MQVCSAKLIVYTVSTVSGEKLAQACIDVWNRSSKSYSKITVYLYLIVKLLSREFLGCWFLQSRLLTLVEVKCNLYYNFCFKFSLSYIKFMVFYENLVVSFLMARTTWIKAKQEKKKDVILVKKIKNPSLTAGCNHFFPMYTRQWWGKY